MSGIAQVTLFVTAHPWCRDVQRDEAVRAVEDNRPGPLPTLEEAIAQPFADSRGASETDRLRADADFLLRLAHDQTKDFGELLSVVGNIDARVERMEGMMAKNRSGSSAPAAEQEAPAASDAAGTHATFFEADMPLNFRYAVDSFFPPNVHGYLRQCVTVKEVGRE